MNTYEHLPLPVFQANIQRQTRPSGGGYNLPEGRNKSTYARETIQTTDNLINSFQIVKNKFAGNINPSLIYEIQINQKVNSESFETTLNSMGIQVLSVAENKKGYWIVFSSDEKLTKFKQKLKIYGSEEGPKYEFFNAITSLRDIPREAKIGRRLKENPLNESPDFINIELWRMVNQQRNEEFIKELRKTYSNNSTFRITDTLITKSFVLLRVKLTQSIFNEIIVLKEIAHVDRPAIPSFNQFDFQNINVAGLTMNSPDKNAAGILIVDSGIVASHPMLENCIGDEENFQTGEHQIQDTIGHGTSVAGCAAYGDIEKCINEKVYNPSNWIFSAKVMYAEKSLVNDRIYAIYDPEKLVEHQLKDAVDSFLSNHEYHIKIVNISLGNSNETWHKEYNRQLPLAALIDELAYTYPSVTFIVPTGNQDPINVYSSIEEILENYPNYLINNPEFKILNPATSALALTVGSIAGPERVQKSTYGPEGIKVPIAKQNMPSPFTRSGLGINGMIKPEIVEYGGNTILFNNYGRIQSDIGGRIALLNNQTTQNLIRFDYGTSFSAPKVAHLAGQIANKFPQKSANFINNMLLMGAEYPFIPDNAFYNSKKGYEEEHLSVCGYGLPGFERAVSSFDNRAVLFDEGRIGLNQIKVYSLQLPELFFNEKGKKRIIITLTFNPETRSSRGDSYLGNRMEYHLFHSINPNVLVEKYGVISEETEQKGVPEELKKFELALFPGANTRKAGCHQKAWKDFKREPKNIPGSPISLVLLSYNKWISDQNRIQEYCISVTFEHEKEILLYNAIRTSIQTRARVR